MGLRKLSRDLNAVHGALSFKSTDILPIEQYKVGLRIKKV
jgi:N-acetylneuraminate synthase